MAITTSDERIPLYRLQQVWITDVLEQQGSLLTPGTSIWTKEHLDELQQHFVEQPDLTHGRSFLDKLQMQLNKASQGARQLMAELLVEHFLVMWPGAISAAKKLQTIEAVLSWMSDPPPVPDDVRRALELGPLHPGQYALTRRDVQLSWLIQFCTLWLDLPAEERLRLRSDPWAFRDLTESMRQDGTESSRLALLHLLFPTTFEAIVAAEHKRLIIHRFEDEPGHEEDPDRRLLELRRILGKGDASFDWYSDPMEYRWRKNRQRWQPLMDWLREIHQTPELRADERPYKLRMAEQLAIAAASNQAGDASWIATLRSAMTDKENNLTRWQDHVPLLDWADAHLDQAQQAFTTLWNQEVPPIRALRTFFDALPSEALGSAVGVRVNVGSFLLMARDPSSLPPVKITPIRDAWKLAGWGPDSNLSPTDVYDRALTLFAEVLRDSQTWPEPFADLLDVQGALWSLTSRPDKPPSWTQTRWDDLRQYRGEEIASVVSVVDQAIRDSTDDQVSTDHEIDFIEAAAADLLVDRAVLDEMIYLLEDKKQIVLYGPPGTGKTYVAQRLARAIAEEVPERFRLVQFHPAVSYEDFIEGLRPKVLPNGNVTYELTHGPLIRAAEAARRDPEATKHVLVVDEINRANLPKVLGELLFLLEYRDVGANLMYRPNEVFTLPKNLYLIGTMNTADRSVALIDAAMRRRFHFLPFFPHEGAMKGLLRRWLTKRSGRIAIADLLDAINAELRDDLGEHLAIGPSHFMQTDLSDLALARIWTYNIFPLLEEQFWGRTADVERWRWDAVRARHAGLLKPADGPANGDAHPIADSGASDKVRPDEAAT